MTNEIKKVHHFPEIGVPFFWPFETALDLRENLIGLEKKNMKFLEEVIKTEIIKKKPDWASKNKVLSTLHTFTLRDFSIIHAKDELPVLIIPPYAGHSSVIADFNKRQSLVETLLENGIKRIALLDWHSATVEMKNYDIDNYLAELHVAISDLGEKVHLIGLCQGGWFASLYAARFPEKIASLVLAGSPIDTQAGQGAIKMYANTLPLSFFENLVAAGGGLLRGDRMLEGFKSLHPQQQYINKYAELYKHVEDPDYVKRVENFECWYEYTIDLPGRWYLQVVSQLFKENQFANGKFKGLGKTLDPRSIYCPLYLLAGEQDDITPKEQVFSAEKNFGTSPNLITKDLAEGGHIGLFMGNKALLNNWPRIAAWILKQDERNAI